MSDSEFERCVFINCPFDKDYDGLLQAILFCVVYLGFEPRLARERDDAGESRLNKIIELIEGSKYSIHDLSRCQAGKRGELYRLNMPFELGIDYGCRQFGGARFAEKRILILEEKPYRYQAAISDLSGCDIQAHGADFAIAIRKVRNWLVGEANLAADAAARIAGAYYDFQAWYLKEQEAAGFSDADIADYSTPELLSAMKTWWASGKPIP